MKATKAITGNAKSQNGKPVKNEMPVTEGVKLQVVKGTTEEQSNAVQAPPAEPTKMEIKQNVVVRNVEATVQMVEELHVITRQRKALIDTIDRFDKFKFNLQDDVDHDKESYYRGCELTIEDSDGNKFITRNAVLIQKAALYTRNLCVDKLAEVEAEIVLPPAA